MTCEAGRPCDGGSPEKRSNLNDDNNACIHVMSLSRLSTARPRQQSLEPSYDSQAPIASLQDGHARGERRKTARASVGIASWTTTGRTDRRNGRAVLKAFLSHPKTGMQTIMSKASTLSHTILSRMRKQSNHNSTKQHAKQSKRVWKLDANVFKI